MLLKRFDPIGNVDDAGEDAREAWSDAVKEIFRQVQLGHPDEAENDSPRAQFYDPTETETPDDAAEAEITWSAFPRQIQQSFPGDLQRWQRADASREVQDEYLEWSAPRDEKGRIRKVTFTSEPREWWIFLSQVDPDKVLELYRKFVSEEVKPADLFDADGDYVVRNRWNRTTTEGAMHLIHGPNPLFAEVELAAAATIVRERDGRTLTGEQELIQCGLYGAPTRNSDPHIGGEVNALARQKADITLKNPVGLYIGGLSTGDFETPDGSDPAAYWSYVRGSEGFPVRAEFEVPEDAGFTVSDITIDGEPIRFASQIVDHITVRLTGVACRIGESDAKPMGCVTPKLQAGARALALSAKAPSQIGEFQLASRFAAT
jgi:hypothetical protein